MATEIALLSFTQGGIEHVEESPDRLDDAKELAESLGCEITGFYLTFGEYDAVSILDAPDDETAARFALTIGTQGAISTETLIAFPEGEYREIIAGVP